MKIGQKPIYALFARRPSIILLPLCLNKVYYYINFPTKQQVCSGIDVNDKASCLMAALAAHLLVWPHGHFLSPVLGQSPQLSAWHNLSHL